MHCFFVSLPRIGGLWPALLFVAHVLLVTTDLAGAVSVRQIAHAVPLTESQNDILRSIGVAPAAPTPVREPAAASTAERAIPAHTSSIGNSTTSSATGVKLDSAAEDLLKSLTVGGSAELPTATASASTDAIREMQRKTVAENRNDEEARKSTKDAQAQQDSKQANRQQKRMADELQKAGKEAEERARREAEEEAEMQAELVASTADETHKVLESSQAEQQAQGEKDATNMSDVLKTSAQETVARAHQLQGSTSDHEVVEQAQAAVDIKAHQHEEDNMVVNFLFLVNNGLPHSDVWGSFFSEASPHQVNSFVHCRDRHGCENSGLLNQIPKMQIVETVPTYYCHDLVTAMVHLLKSSLKNTTARRTKFVFISDSTLPLKPFPEVYTALDADDASDICVLPSHHWGTLSSHSSESTRTSYLVKHSQWVVLNREHAEKMVQDWKAVDAQGQWRVPIAKRDNNNLVPQSTGVTSFLRKSYANTCADEWAFFATIFGAIPDIDESKGETAVPIPGWSGGSLMMRGAGIHNVQGQCRTFAYWDDWGEDFNNLAKLLASDYPLTEVSCYPNCGLHPMTLSKLSDAALLAMRRSPFLFGRKFALSPGQSVLNSFHTIALAKTPPQNLAPPDVRNLPAAGSLRNDIASQDFLSDTDPTDPPSPKRRLRQELEHEPKENNKTWWSWMWNS